MSDNQIDDNMTLEQGISIVDKDYVQRIINYLHSKVLEKSAANHIKCYSVVLKLCDELDKAKDLNEYFKKVLQDYITNYSIPAMKKLKEEGLLQEFVK